jgi:nucleotide-binding universal stress UspA family protein
MHRILVGLSGSEQSLAAMRMAIELAKRHDAHLVGVGVVDVPHLTAPESVPLGAGEFKARRDAAVVAAAHEAVDEILGKFGEHCETEEVVFECKKFIGDPVDILVRQSQRCDLLVVGKRHFPHLEWESSSRTLEHVLRQSPRPVICVPAPYIQNKVVLVAYDASVQAARALQAFVQSNIGADHQIHVAAIGSEAQEHAGLAAEFLRIHKVTSHLHVEAALAEPAPRLLEISQQIQAGLIVLGCYGQPRMKEFFFGSVTKAILSETTVPLFLYH